MRVIFKGRDYATPALSVFEVTLNRHEIRKLRHLIGSFGDGNAYADKLREILDAGVNEVINT